MLMQSVSVCLARVTVSSENVLVSVVVVVGNLMRAANTIADQKHCPVALPIRSDKIPISH